MVLGMQVTAVAIAQNGDIVSASLDKYALVAFCTDRQRERERERETERYREGRKRMWWSLEPCNVHNVLWR